MWKNNPVEGKFRWRCVNLHQRNSENKKILVKFGVKISNEMMIALYLKKDNAANYYYTDFIDAVLIYGCWVVEKE